MTSSAVEPPRESAAPRAGGRWSAVRHALLHTFGGRAFLAGVALKAIYLAARLAVGAEPALVSATGTLGSVALIVAAGCLIVRMAPRARRNLLWRVRAQLILSYVFIGVIPALLIVAFFAVSGLVLFLNVASYLVTNGFDNVKNEAIYVARLTATEIQRGPGPGAAQAILSQRESALASIYPGASMALVPTASGEPCVGGPAAALRAGSVPDIVAAEREVIPETRAGAASRPAAVTPVAVGPWEHADPPKALPTWVSCAGFGGIVVEPAAAMPGGQASVTDAPAAAIVRGVGLSGCPAAGLRRHRRHPEERRARRAPARRDERQDGERQHLPHGRAAGKTRAGGRGGPPGAGREGGRDGRRREAAPPLGGDAAGHGVGQRPAGTDHGAYRRQHRGDLRPALAGQSRLLQLRLGAAGPHAVRRGAVPASSRRPPS